MAFDVIHTVVNQAIGFRTIDATHQMRSNFGQTQTDAQTVTYTFASTPCRSLSVSETTQYARVTNGPRATIGKQLQYVPQSSATAAWSTVAGRTDVALSLSFLGQTYADDANTQPLGTAILGGVHFGFPLKGGTRVRIDGDNIFGAHYLSSLDRIGTPASIALGIEMPFGKV